MQLVDVSLEEKRENTDCTAKFRISELGRSVSF